METLQDRYMDKSEWGDGPWQHEPDKQQWQDIETGLPCLIVRGPMGALCGYVGVSKDHPWFEVDHDEYETISADVHGGLTFSSHCAEDGKICHIVEEGEDDNVWWLGFDCSHLYDLAPKMHVDRRFPPEVGDVYRTLSYVRGECERLAVQAIAAQ